MSARQRERRRTIRLTSAIVGLTFIAVVFLAPAIGGLITQ